MRKATGREPMKAVQPAGMTPTENSVCSNECHNQARQLHPAAGLLQGLMQSSHTGSVLDVCQEAAGWKLRKQLLATLYSCTHPECPLSSKGLRLEPTSRDLLTYAEIALASDSDC